MKITVGSRVEIRSMPFKGRTGVVRKRRWFFTEVWCDYPDLLGRQLVRTTARDLRHIA